MSPFDFELLLHSAKDWNHKDQNKSKETEKGRFKVCDKTVVTSGPEPTELAVYQLVAQNIIKLDLKHDISVNESRLYFG